MRFDGVDRSSLSRVQLVMITILIATLLGAVGFASGWLAIGDSPRRVGRLRSADLNESTTVSVSTSARATLVPATARTPDGSGHAADGDGDD